MNDPMRTPAEWLYSDHRRERKAMQCPAFAELANFIRVFAGISQDTRITPETQFEEDLGITGDDGCELIEEVEVRFGIPLYSEKYGYRETFHLAPNEYLFHSEPCLFGFLRSESVRPLTVGQLYSALQQQAKTYQS